MTRLERLGLLLPWLNDEGEAIPFADVRGLLRDFIESFDGGEEAGFVQVYSGEREPWVPEFIHADMDTAPLHTEAPRPEESTGAPWEAEAEAEHELWELRQYLVDLLRKGFPQEPGYPAPVGPWAQAFPSLRIGVRGTHAKAPQPPTGPEGSLAKRRYRAKRRTFYASPGTYTLLVDGRLRDLVCFLVAHVLTGPGMAVIARCPAPAPSNWDARCGRFLVVAGQGRPRVFCSEACRVRQHAEKLRKQQLEFRRPRRRKRVGAEK